MGGKKEKILLVVAGLGLVLYGLWTGLGKKDKGIIEGRTDHPSQESVEEEESDHQEASREEESSESSPLLYVHVDGAVKNPGVYEFQEGARVKDAIEEAGGLTPAGDTGSLNLAQRLSDEMKIHVPKEGETAPSDLTTQPSGGGGEGKAKKVNINRASLEELTSLPSVGESRAREIISFRERSPFVKPEDIMNISGIGQKTFDKMKDLISVK
ncbi:ComEA family DNA-binding protein [Kallipyga massiliensis]|uniref:ComEA family DNA-binding protein n=1 Tax=Kallipyga massiliensis TaxID=1472764 RepID=UPI0026F0ACD6|nr:ComEA family DNA-binding protein [Kallipyga massiliensis]